MFSNLLSKIPGLSTIKSYAVIGLSLAAALFFGLYNREKANRQKEKIKGIQQARKTEKEANKAMMDGLKNEQNIKDNINTSDDDKLI